MYQHFWRAFIGDRRQVSLNALCERRLQGLSADQLSETDYDHVMGEATSSGPTLGPGGARGELAPGVHYYLIASGNQVMKDGKTRERVTWWRRRGLMDSFRVAATVLS